MLDPDNPNHEKQLIQQAIDGHKQAFGCLYENHSAAIWRYIFHRLNNRTEADDMTEIVFMKAWEKLPSFGKQGKGMNFRAWLYRIAHNALIDRYRKDKFEMPLNDEISDTSHLVSEGKYNPGLDQLEEIKQALQTLDDISQHVIISRFISGLSPKETALSIGISEGNVRVIQYRALRKLREILGESYE